MKVFSVYIFLILVLGQSFSKGIIWIDFEMNRDYIAKNFCVNRDKPAMHCKGKCQLAKNMEDENRSNNPLRPNWSKFPAFEVITSGIQLSLPPVKMSSSLDQSFYTGKPVPVFLPAVFHPPSC